MKDVKLIIFLLAIFTICTLLLSFAQFFYDKASVVFNRRLYAEILNLYDIEHTFPTIDNDFAASFSTVQAGGKTYYISENDNPRTIGFKTEGAGLWSTIEIFVSVKIKEEKIFGLLILSQGETPGLGARISEPQFLNTFFDLDINPEVKIVKFSMSSNEVDAISGATKTSSALEKIVNKGISELKQNLDYLNQIIEDK
jgi:Na+-transporting NADH:ubiquinone oxidoreductase subunit C